MKRYALFTFSEYYPAGGWEDFKGSFDSIEEARTEGKRLDSDHMQIVDLEKGEEVA